MLNAVYSTDYHPTPLIASLINEGGLLVTVALSRSAKDGFFFFFLMNSDVEQNTAPLNYKVELLIYNMENWTRNNLTIIRLPIISSL